MYRSTDIIISTDKIRFSNFGHLAYADIVNRTILGVVFWKGKLLKEMTQFEGMVDSSRKCVVGFS